jgi:hypothetical protein
MKILALILIALFFGQNQAYSQKFLKKLQDKVESKVSEKLEDKIDEKIDEEIDKSFDSIEEPERDEHGSDNISSFSNASSNKTYSFNQSITYDISDAKGKESTQMTFLTNANESYFGIEIISNEETKIIQISDSTESISLIETGEMKMQTGTSISIDKIMAKNNQQQIDDDMDITKTGNTKDILGYTCYEYIVKNEEGTSTVWISNDSALEKVQIYQNTSKLKGLMLESSFNNGKKVISTMVATNINTAANVSVDASEYKAFGK